MALEGLGVAPEDSIFVDDVEGNVIAAEDLGMTAFLVDRGGHHRDADCQRIESLEEIVRYVSSHTS